MTGFGPEHLPYGVFRRAGESPRVGVRGASLSLAPDAAQAIAMAVHELATNAVKHGALSADGGRVDIVWGVQSKTLRLTWTERGGPAVVPPERTGFGSNLLKRALGGRLNGATELDWRPEGLVCELRLPLPEDSARPEAFQQATAERLAAISEV